MAAHRVLLVGFKDDIQDLASLLSTSADIALVTENANKKDIPLKADIVIYAMSEDTSFSTQLHGVFVYIHDLVLSKEEYILPVGNVDLKKGSFPEMSHLPQILIGEILQKIKWPKSVG